MKKTELLESGELHIVDHPMISHLLGLMRNKDCPHGQFRTLMEQLSVFMLYEAMLVAEIPAIRTSCETAAHMDDGKHAVTEVEIIEGHRIALVGIMRAGMLMSASAQRILPRSPMGHIGATRDETGENVSVYYRKLPSFSGINVCFVFDTIIATGKTGKKALGHIVKALDNTNNRAVKLYFVNVLCSKAGVDAIHRCFPDVPIITAAQDKNLNEKNEVIPGIGDAGDRLYDTPSDGGNLI